MIHVPVSCVVNTGRVELFTAVPGRRGFGRNVPVSTPASGCVRVVIGRPVSTTVGRVGRGVSQGVAASPRQLPTTAGSAALCRRERGYVPVES